MTISDRVITSLTDGQYSNEAQLEDAEQLSVYLRYSDDINSEAYEYFFNRLGDLKSLETLCLHLDFMGFINSNSLNMLECMRGTAARWAPKLKVFGVYIQGDNDESTFISNREILRIKQSWESFCEIGVYFEALETLEIKYREYICKVGVRQHLLPGATRLLHLLPSKNKMTTLNLCFKEDRYVDPNVTDIISMPMDVATARQNLAGQQHLALIDEINSFDKLQNFGFDLFSIDETRFKKSMIFLVAQWASGLTTLRTINLYNLAVHDFTDVNATTHMIKLMLDNPYLETVDIRIILHDTGDVDMSTDEFVFNRDLSECLAHHFSLKEFNCILTYYDDDTDSYVFPEDASCNSMVRSIDQFFLPCLKNTGIRSLQFNLEPLLNIYRDKTARQNKFNEVMTQLLNNFSLLDIVLEAGIPDEKQKLEYDIKGRSHTYERIVEFIEKRNRTGFDNYSHFELDETLEAYPPMKELIPFSINSFIGYVSRDFNALKLRKNSYLSRDYSDTSNGSSITTKNTGVTLLRKSIDQISSLPTTGSSHSVKLTVVELWEKINSYLSIKDFRNLMLVTGGPLVRSKKISDSAKDKKRKTFDQENTELLGGALKRIRTAPQEHVSEEQPVGEEFLNQQFIRCRVPGDGDCGYTALLSSREEAYSLLSSNILIISELIQLPVQQALIEKPFYDHLVQKQLITLPFEHISDELREEMSKDESIQCAFLEFDVRDKKIDGGYTHPCVLQALAYIQNIELYIWTLEHEKLTPLRNHERDYFRCSPPKIDKRLDILFTGGNHFDRLELKRNSFSSYDASATQLIDSLRSREREENTRLLSGAKKHSQDEDLEEDIEEETFALMDTNLGLFGC